MSICTISLTRNGSRLYLRLVSIIENYILFVTLTLLSVSTVGWAKDVAKLVGNSPEIIYGHYAAGKRNLVAPGF
jgi:hypothetical protein